MARGGHPNYIEESDHSSNIEDVGEGHDSPPQEGWLHVNIVGKSKEIKSEVSTTTP